MRESLLLMKGCTRIIFLLAFIGGFLLWGQEECFAQKRKDKDNRDDSDKASQTVTSTGNTGMLIDAKKEMILGNVKEAYRRLEAYVEQYPEDPAGLYELARLEANEKKFDIAIRHLIRASELNPANYWYQLFLAELYQLTADYKRSISIYEDIVRRHSENPEYKYQLAALYLTTGRFQDAADTYDRIEQETGISEDIILQKQKIYSHLKEPQKAEAELKKLIDAYPGESRYYSILAEYYMANEKPDKALETYQKIAEIDPDNAYIHMSLADFYRKTGNRDKAYEELKVGFRNPNLDIDSKVTILLSFYSINQLYSDLKDQAFELTRILIKTHPDDPKAYSIYGDLLSQDKQYPAAREAFLKVISIDSSKYLVWEELLRISLLMEDFTGLAGYSERAINLFPDQPIPYLFNGLSHLQLKHNESSLASLKQGVRLVVENDELLAQFFMYLGDANHANGNEEESDTYYDKALQIKPNNAYVLNNYAYYLSLRGDNLEKAEKMAKQAVSLEPENSSFQDTYGWVLYRLGRYPEAREWIEKALKNEKEVSGEVLEHYGDVCYRLGEKDQALNFWYKAQVKGGASALLERKISEKKLIEQ